MHVGADGIRNEPLRDRGDRLPKQETALAVSHVEQHAASPGFKVLGTNVPDIVE
jgi:hypothetical protein